MIDVLGYIGAFFFAICSLPQVIKVFKTNNTKSISGLFLLFWFIGEICTWSYIMIQNYASQVFQIPLHINYLINFIGVSYLLFKKTINEFRGI